MLRVEFPLPLRLREEEVDVDSEGSLSAFVPMVPSFVARSLAAAALRFGLFEIASLTSLVMAGELNSDSQPVEIRPFWPLEAALQEAGGLMV